MLLLYGLTALLYASLSVYLYLCLTREQPIAKIPTLIGMAIAVILHATLLFPQIITLYGLNFNLFNSISLTTLFFVGFFGLFALYRPILSLGVLALPTALVGLSIGHHYGQSAYTPLIDVSVALQAHILLSFAAYCVLLMAFVQSIILRLQIRELKRQSIHRFWVSKLPSLQSMESLLFDMILMGFVLLSIALGVGFVLTYDVLAQHIAHKLVFSVLSWLIFGAFLIGHYKQGWQGKKATSFTFLGFALLALGFVGSKVVLELIIG